MDEVSRALGRIEGCLGQMQQDITDIKTVQADMSRRVNKIEKKIVVVSSSVAVVASLIGAKIRSMLGGDC